MLLALLLAVAAGTARAEGPTAFITYCWRTSSGAFPLDFLDFPTPLNGTNEFVALDAGAQHVCGLDAAGAAGCAGSGEQGQLGDGRSGGNVTAAAPVAVAGGHAFSAISAGRSHT